LNFFQDCFFLLVATTAGDELVVARCAAEELRLAWAEVLEVALAVTVLEASVEWHRCWNCEASAVLRQWVLSQCELAWLARGHRGATARQCEADTSGVGSVGASLRASRVLAIHLDECLRRWWWRCWCWSCWCWARVAQVLDEDFSCGRVEVDGALVDFVDGCLDWVSLALAACEGVDDKLASSARRLVREGCASDALVLWEDDVVAVFACWLVAFALSELLLSWWRWWWWVWSLGDLCGAWIRCDQALVRALLDADETVLTPAGGPAVLHDPVWWVVVVIEADDQNTVVDLLGDAVGQDATSVCLPRSCVNSD